MNDKLKMFNLISGEIVLLSGVAWGLYQMNKVVNKMLGIPSKRELKKLEETREISENLVIANKLISEESETFE